MIATRAAVLISPVPSGRFRLETIPQVVVCPAHANGQRVRDYSEELHVSKGSRRAGGDAAQIVPSTTL